MTGRSLTFRVLLAGLMVLLGEAQVQADQQKVVMCHYHRYRLPADVKEKVVKLSYDSEVNYPCTHLVYGQNLLVKPSGYIDLRWRLPKEDRDMTGIIKKKKPNMKLFLSVWLKGGHSYPTSDVAFALRTIYLLRKYHFDGVEIDTGHSYYSPIKDKFSRLLKTLYERFLEEARKTKRPRLIISVTVLHQPKNIQYYDPRELNSYADYVVVNAIKYDIDDASEYDWVPHHPSPFHRIQVASVRAWLRNRLKRSKLVLPFTTYALDGYYCQLKGTSHPPVCARVYAHKIHVGKYRVPYYELCRTKSHEVPVPQPWRKIIDLKPYDTKESVEYRMKYILQNNLSGTKMYYAQYDDYLDTCGQGMFPLGTLAYEMLTGITIPPSNLSMSKSTGGPSTPITSALLVFLAVCTHWLLKVHMM